MLIEAVRSHVELHDHTTNILTAPANKVQRNNGKMNMNIQWVAEMLQDIHNICKLFLEE